MTQNILKLLRKINFELSFISHEGLTEAPSNLQPELLNTHMLLSADARGGLNVTQQDGKPIQALNDV